MSISRRSARSQQPLSVRIEQAVASERTALVYCCFLVQSVFAGSWGETLLPFLLVPKLYNNGYIYPIVLQ